MPSKSSVKPARCHYVENRRRCTRNGVPGTNPALCRVHQIVFAQVGRPPQRTDSALSNVLEDLLNGQRVSTDRLRDAAQEVLGGWGIGGNIAGGYHPPLDRPTGDPLRDFFRAQASAFRDQARATGHRYAPPVDPEVAELQESRRRARVAMGFAESEQITREQLRDRHRKLVRKHHPDVGGSLEKMQIINAANDILEAELA